MSLVEREIETPSRELLFKLAEALSTTPDYLESGKEPPEHAARAARLQLWPELVYHAANHTTVRLGIEGKAPIVTPPALQAAIQQAQDSPHLCDYLRWSDTPPAKETAAALETTDDLDTLIRQSSGGELHEPEIWLDLAKLKRAGAKIGEWVKGDNPKADYRHTIAGGCEHSGRGRATQCFTVDLMTVFRWHGILLRGMIGLKTSDRAAVAFGCSFYREKFVDAVFPELFYAVARVWSDRRLSAWFEHLELPADLFTPLVAIARHSADLDAFKAGARRLLDQAPVEDREIFLASLPDPYIRWEDYRKRFGEQPFAWRDGYQGMAGFNAEGSLARRHRRIRRQARAQVLLDMIFQANDPEPQQAANALLEEKAPPHTWIDDTSTAPFDLPAGVSFDNLPDKPPPGWKGLASRRKTKDGEKQEGSG